MKRVAFISIILLISQFAFSQQMESFHFRFIESNKEIINTTLTNLISIDNVRGDTVFAYANTGQMVVFKKLGYKYTIIPEMAINTKSISMATTVDQMANWDKYPTYSTYRGLMKKFEHDYPALCKLDYIGTTLGGHKIYVVKLSKNVSLDESEVEVFYTSTMHGDETTGYILMLRLIDSLLSSYATSSRVAAMLDNMAIYINPNANPDGTYRPDDNNIYNARRSNNAGFDLNRNFPDPRLGFFTTIQPETQIMMDYATSRRFTLSANFHGGIELVNYPWDSWNSSQRLHADNNWYIHFSRQYADTAQKYGPLGYFTGEDNGITNGGDWYVVAGGRQDYMNWWHKCREITIEISDTKLVGSETLPNFWNYNNEALLGYLEAARQGVNGIITNTEGHPVKAKVFITGHDTDSSHVYSSSATGFYARPIEPGTWQATYSAKGYQSQTYSIVVDNWNSSVVKNIELKPEFDVIFNVKDLGTPLENVNINFNSIAKQTSASGQTIYNNVPQNDAYSYNASLSGYHTAVAQVNITSDRNININLIPDASTVYSVVFNVANQSNPIEDATIQFNGVEQQTSTTGSVPFTNILQNVNYNYSVSKLGYQTVSSQVDVAGDKTVSVELIPYLYTIDVYVKHLGVAIPSATVVFNGLEKQTLADGAISFSDVLYGKKYDYSISKSGYKSIQGIIDVLSNKTIDIELIPMYNVSINVLNQGLPLANAKVLFNSLLLHTNSNGEAIFSNTPFGYGYFYSVSLSNYYNASGVIDVLDNKDVDIELTGVGVKSLVADQNMLKVWPNPFENSLTISFELDKPSFVNLAIYSLDGRLVSNPAERPGYKGLNAIFISNLTGLSNGSYIVVLRVDNKSYSQIIQHIR